MSSLVYSESEHRHHRSVFQALLTYQGKFMRDPSIRWQLGSKPQGRKHFITVIVLDDFSNCLQGHGIGIQLVGAHVVEGSGLGWVTLGRKKAFY